VPVFRYPWKDSGALRWLSCAACGAVTIGRMSDITDIQGARFAELARPYLAHPAVQSMGAFIQHGNVTTLAHVVRVARCAFDWAQRFHLRVNERDLVTGALLHDFYLYDWHKPHPDTPHHATRHPLYAAENAARIFDANGAVLAIIRTHMWPLPPGRVPASREAVLVNLADKYCSFYETFFLRSNRSAASAPLPKDNV
jgi:uncharacterized protein